MLWQGGTGDGQTYPMPLQLQGFDASSLQASTARHVLEGGALFVSPRILGLTASAGRVGAVWLGGASGSDEVRVAQLSADGLPRVSSLGKAGTAWMGLGLDNAEPLNLLADGRAALYWPYAAFTTSASSAQQMRGVMLGSDGAPVRTVPGGLDDELLPTAWALPSTMATTVGAGTSLLLGSRGHAPWRSGDSTPTSSLQLTQARPPSNGGLATAPSVVQRWRAYDTLYGPFDTYGSFAAKRWVSLRDRVLVLDDDLRTVGLVFLR